MRTIASGVPIASAAVEMINQLEGDETTQRIGSLEKSELALQAKVQDLALSLASAPSVAQEWPVAVAEYFKRIVDFVVVYDGGYHSRAQRGQELVLPVAHGCFVGTSEVVTCREAMEFAQGLARIRFGRVIMWAGLAEYRFEPEPPDKLAGLVACRITERDEKKWARHKEEYEELGAGRFLREPITSCVRYSLRPWIGQEVGFLHSGEATDAQLFDRNSPLQFDAATISHFRHTEDRTVGSFVTGVLPGRFLRTGAPVFSRDAALLGVIADTQSYPSDVGQRAIVRSHPWPAPSYPAQFSNSWPANACSTAHSRARRKWRLWASP